MKRTWLRQWNRWQFLTTQLTLISVLFLYVMVAPQAPLVTALFITVALSYLLAHWIGLTLYPWIDLARLQGDFKVMRATVFVHHIHLIAGIALFGTLMLVSFTWFALARYTTLGIFVIGLVAFDKVLSTTLRAQASPIVLQAHALRRSVLLLGLIASFLLRAQPWFDLLLFTVLIATPLSSILRLVLGHGQMYKEFRYRRQFEDSGKQRSLVALFVTLTNRYARSFVQLAWPLGLLVGLGLLIQFVDLPQTTGAVTSSVLLFVGVMAVARTVVTTLMPDTTPWLQYVQASNHSQLREQLGTLSEQLLYRSLLIGVVWFGMGLVLGPSVYDSLPILLSSTAVVIAACFYRFNQHGLRILRERDQWLIVLGALVIFGFNTLLLVIYYPSIALMMGFVMSAIWVHCASLYVWTRSFDFELRVHLTQSAMMYGIVSASLIVNAAIYWLLLQFPLGVGRFVEQLVFLGLFVIITSVVMYSLTYALGVHRSLKSRTDILHQLSTQFMDYEEEEAIW